MDPSIKKETFVGYSKSSKSYRIYVPRQRHIEVGKYVTFHEEDSFKHSKELQCDLYMEEHETPMTKNPYSGSPHLDVERDKPKEYS